MHGHVSGPVYSIYYPILAAVGIPGNLVTIAILSRGRCGLSKCVSRYMMGMAVTDILVLVTAVILNRIRSIYFPMSFLSITPVCSVRIALIYATRDSSVWLTVAFTFDRFVAICCQKLKIKYCTERTALVVIITACGVSCAKNIPRYLIYEPLYVRNDVPWFCDIKLSFYSDVFWIVFDCIDYIMNPFAPFILILLLNTLTVKHILAANKARRRVRAKSNCEDQDDPEVKNRKKSIILLFAISGSFIVLWTPRVVNFFYVRFTNSRYSIGSNPNDPMFILQESGIMLQLLSCCTNTCIYAVTQKKFREEFANMLKASANRFINMVKS
ncbi:probable G-protein coupled receptor 139 [Amblyraja radiata]|uniref:probable G-protein coupled receptor 139 n=1 Tax=Amblyraja radiata TaxID=386614 RepID=UPI001401C449|nr:probable G-protein coupled receptor 139 [Amblyraja radiata]